MLLSIEYIVNLLLFFIIHNYQRWGVIMLPWQWVLSS